MRFVCDFGFALFGTLNHWIDMTYDCFVAAWSLRNHLFVVSVCVDYRFQCVSEIITKVFARPTKHVGGFIWIPFVVV